MRRRKQPGCGRVALAAMPLFVSLELVNSGWVYFSFAAWCAAAKSATALAPGRTRQKEEGREGGRRGSRPRRLRLCFLLRSAPEQAFF